MFRNFIAAVLTCLAFAGTAAHAASPVDVNKATQAELETIKGIGPGLSTKILDARKTAQFKDWGDLVDRVGGVGPGNAKRFSQAGLTVGGAAFDAAAMPAAESAKATKRAKDAKDDKDSKAAKPRADKQPS